MWKDYSAHHIQRGDVTAVVWGAPGVAAEREDHSVGDTCPTLSSSPARAGVVDAEALTRGRRADNPFVQQCDLIFPLPDRHGYAGSQQEEEGLEEEQEDEQERRARAFVVRTLGTAFYYRARGPLSALLREPFLGSCILAGGFSALALNAPSDQGNSFAILPGGVLVLSLDRESFQTLGLPGEAAPTRPNGKSKRAGAGAGSTGGSVGVLGGGAGGPDRYVSAVDLSSKAFRPGKPLHDRVLSCLSGGPGVRGGGECSVDMVVCWWGEAGSGTSGVVEGEGAAGRDGTRGLSGQEESAGGNGEAARAATGCGREDSRKAGEAEGSGGKHKQRWGERGRDQCCREIFFPPGFSSERVDLAPDICFFREACCPDLDFVGQGFAASPMAAAAVATVVPPTSQQGGESTGAPQSGSLSTNAGGNNATTTTAAQRIARASQLPPPVPSTPGWTKCRLVLDMFEWLGAVSCGLDAVVRRGPSLPEAYLSEFATPRHLRYRRSRVVCRARLRGFLPPLAVARFVAAAGSAAAANTSDGEAGGHLNSSSSSSSPACRARHQQERRQPNGCSWGSVTAWPFRDAPRAYPGASAPYAGGQKSKRGGRGRGGRGKDGGGIGRNGVAERCTRDWPVGGHGVYTVVACPGETAVAYVSARCPGPGW